MIVFVCRTLSQYRQKTCYKKGGSARLHGADLLGCSKRLQGMLQVVRRTYDGFLANFPGQGYKTGKRKRRKTIFIGCI